MYIHEYYTFVGGDESDLLSVPYKRATFLFFFLIFIYLFDCIGS